MLIRLLINISYIYMLLYRQNKSILLLTNNMRNRRKSSQYVMEKYKAIKNEPVYATVDQFMRKIKELVLK